MALIPALHESLVLDLSPRDPCCYCGANKGTNTSLSPFESCPVCEAYVQDSNNPPPNHGKIKLSNPMTKKSC